jgi:hypothetical protein
VSKYQFQESDIYLAGTDIPRNRLGITEADLLHEDETNACIHASIACVRAADNSMLRQIILDGLDKAETP